MKKVALITIHGMGNVDFDYFKDLKAGLENRLDEHWDAVSFQTVQYAPILQKNQSKLWNKILSTSSNDIDARRLRQFFLYGFGDAGSLEYSAHGDQIIYKKVQQKIVNALDHAFIDFEEDVTKPIIIVAHSLGCQVISNYLWDAEKNGYIFKDMDGVEAKKIKFRKLKSLRHLVTTGCNIPLFIGGLKKRKCFKKPAPNFVWDNYYDPDDVLGWPLRQLDKSFEILNDHHINAGGIFTAWNPLSHTKYWNDGDVLDPIADILRKFV